MAWLFVLVLLLAPPAGPQARQRKTVPAKPRTAPAAPVKWPIESLGVEGNSNYTPAQILVVAGLKIGQAAGKGEFEAARDRLMAAGVFENVGYRYTPAPDGKGLAATFQVTEIAQVYAFRFERLAAAPQRLEEVMRRSDPLFSAKIPGTQAVLDRYAKAIESYLAAEGSKEAVVARLAADDSGQLVIVFQPAAAPPTVAEVRFANNKVISTKTLQNAIAGVAIGLPYAEERFRQVLDTTIRPLYEERGRVRVAFPALRAEKSAQVDGVAVTVDVAEGESYKLGKVHLAGEGLPEKQLLKAGNLQEGDVANFTAVRDGLERMKKVLRAGGYMKAEARLDRSVDDAAKTVDVTVHLEKGSRFVFGKLNVEGLDINAEAAIRKLWALKPGGPFNADYPDYFLARIREDGVFDNLGKTKAKTSVDEQNLSVDVTLSFR